MPHRYPSIAPVSDTKGSFCWPSVRGNHSADQIFGGLGGPGLAVDRVECFFQRPGDGFVWTSFLAAPYGEEILWPTLLGEPSGIASVARPGLRAPERPDARPRPSEDKPDSR